MALTLYEKFYWHRFFQKDDSVEEEKKIFETDEPADEKERESVC